MNGVTLMVAASILIALSGCSTLPKTTRECALLPEIYTTQDEVKQCEADVITREDQAHKRRQMIFRKNSCLWPNVWVGRGRFHGYCAVRRMRF